MIKTLQEQNVSKVCTTTYRNVGEGLGKYVSASEINNICSSGIDSCAVRLALRTDSRAQGATRGAYAVRMLPDRS